MAPELLNGGPATEASDVYSVGVLLFYLVTGRHPCEGRTIDDIRDAHILRRRRSLVSLRQDLPRRFVDTVERALLPNPKDRYPTPAALLEPLQQIGAVAAARGPWAMVRVVVFIALAVFALRPVLGGMLSSVAYNAALRRGEFSDDTVQTWLIDGARGLVAPIALSVIVGVPIVTLTSLRRAVLSMFPGMRGVDRRLEMWFVVSLKRLRLDGPTIGAGLLLLGTSAVAALIWSHWSPLWRVVNQRRRRGIGRDVVGSHAAHARLLNELPSSPFCAGSSEHRVVATADACSARRPRARDVRGNRDHAGYDSGAVDAGAVPARQIKRQSGRRRCVAESRVRSHWQAGRRRSVTLPSDDPENSCGARRIGVGMVTEGRPADDIDVCPTRPGMT